MSTPGSALVRNSPLPRGVAVRGYLDCLPRDRALWAAAILAAALVAGGMWWGGAEHWNPDQMALRSVTLPDRLPLEPSGFLKPPFHTYVVFFATVLPQKIFENGLQALTGSPQNFGPSILWFARSIQLAIFVGMVWVVYSIVRRGSGLGAARATALLMATAAGFILQAHFLTADVPVTFWMLLAFLFAQSLNRTGRLRDYVLAGLLTGVATATKYNGLAVGIAIPVFHALANRSVPFHRMAFDRRLVISMFMVVGGFIVANPFAVITYSKFLSDFVYNYVTTPVFDGTDPSETSYFQFLRRSVEILGWPLFVATLFGAALSLARVRRQASAELATTLAAAAVFVLYFWKFGGFPRLEVRFVLSAIPFLLIAAGPGFGWFARVRPRLAVAALALIVAYNVYASLWVDYRFAADPRMASFQWIARNVPAGATIEASAYTPDWRSRLGVEFVRMPTVTGRYQRLSEMFADDPALIARLRSRDSDENVPWYDAAALRERNPDFVAVDSLYYDRFYANAESDYATIKRFFDDLLAEKLGYEIVYDESSTESPRWLYPKEMVFVDNRLVILKRAQ
ncbi:MAG TPA: glycosyltransferase family 39 protein [Gammaproteobacteria bacterium]